MSQTLEALTRRTETMRGIRGIVHTMKTLSAVNAHPYEQAANAIEDWRDSVLDALQALARMHGSLAQPSDAEALPVLIAFGSDQGLCGNYNELVAETLATHPAAHDEAHILCIGAQMEDALRGLGLHTQATLMTPASADGLGRLAGELVTRIDAARSATQREITVTLAFTERAAHGEQGAVVRQILPLDPALAEDLTDRPWTSCSLPYFDLQPRVLLSALMRNYLFASLFRVTAEALVTENAARLARMQQAEKSIDERLEELTSQTRSARQSAITEELLDVIAGFEALKARRKRSSDAQ